MNYIEFTFTIISTVETEIIQDILTGELGEIGFESFTTENNSTKGYIPEKDYDASKLDDLLRSFPLQDVTIQYSSQLIKAQDWNEEWEKNYFKPIKIDQDCIIRASFHPDEPGFQYTIIIDPKMAFGTGNHETTFLMIQEILQMDLSGKDVLDMGCGTAVLAILAKMKDAQRVVAVDIDEWAYNNALENTRLNQTGDIEVIIGGAEQISGLSPFDVIFANINRNILLQDIKHYSSVLKEGGTLLMSGFYTEDVPLITDEAQKNGLTSESTREKNNWVVVKTRKNNIF